MNVSSLVVKVLPEKMELALAALKDSGLCEVHAQDAEKGAIIVTIEGKDVGEEMDKMRAIEKLPHVLGAALVYSASETGADATTSGNLARPIGPVPDVLKDS
jgi:nitrate reductase NapD